LRKLGNKLSCVQTPFFKREQSRFPSSRTIPRQWFDRGLESALKMVEPIVKINLKNVAKRCGNEVIRLYY